MATWLWPGPRFCTVTPATFAAMPSIVSTPRLRSTAAVGAATEKGAFCRVSSRKREVTVISSVTTGVFSSSAVLAGGGGVACCPAAGGGGDVGGAGVASCPAAGGGGADVGGAGVASCPAAGGGVGGAGGVSWERAAPAVAASSNARARGLQRTASRRPDGNESLRLQVIDPLLSKPEAPGGSARRALGADAQPRDPRPQGPNLRTPLGTFAD